MAMPQNPLSPPPSFPLSPTPTPTSSLEISQQLQRVEILHQQLKAEAQRAQEFLTKLRRGELEAQTQAQLHQEQRQRDREEAEKRKALGDRDGGQSHGMCTCSCPHHTPPPPSSGMPTGQTIAHNRNSFNMNNDVSLPPLTLRTRVDEREVRDLEKRVRGLEGRVRGFEGIPPDREMALLEVERLRRELEGLARRREGLFEGLGCEEALRLRGDNAAAVRAKGCAEGSSGETVGKATAVGRQNIEGKSAKAGSNDARNGGKGRKKV